MGHSKQSNESRARAVAESWERMKARESLNKESEVRNTEVLSDANDANLNSVDASTQTALTSRMIEDMQEKTEDKSMQVFTKKSFIMNGEEYVFYTGLTNCEVLHAVFDFVVPPATVKTKLSFFQEFVLTIIKLRLDLPFKDLAYRFGISVTTVSRIFCKWLTIMDIILIIDCFEVFIE